MRQSRRRSPRRERQVAQRVHARQGRVIAVLAEEDLAEGRAEVRVEDGVDDGVEEAVGKVTVSRWEG